MTISDFAPPESRISRTAWKHLTRFAGPKADVAVALSDQVLAKFEAWLRESCGLNPRTITLYIGALRRAESKAVSEGLIRRRRKPAHNLESRVRALETRVAELCDELGV